MMPDGGAILEAMQRASGTARVGLSRRAGAVRLERLEQAGSARAFLPRVDGAVPEVVLLNTSGGLTGGDRLAYGVEVGAGAAAVAMTQTAERAYASAGGTARMDVRLEVGPGAALDWLPQETILFQGAALTRRTEAELAPDARLLMVETLVLGRAAMGERVTRLALDDRRTVRRGGIPQLVDAVRLGDAGLLTGPAGLNGARAVAMLALVAPGAEDALGPLRAALAGAEGVAAAASAWDGRCVARLMAADGWPLRRALGRALGVLRGRPLPRVWHC
jgi:urease accessory protein